MSDTNSDALVFFGATGDLAYKKIFPSLQAMVKRGFLNVPVVGVAKAGWNIDQFSARAKDSLEKHGSMDLNPNHFRFRVSPEVTVALGMMAKSVDDKLVGESMEMIAVRPSHPDEIDAYERVLHDAMIGDAKLFAREDYVEEAWRIVAWGPAQVEREIVPMDGWHNPEVAAAAAAGAERHAA